MKNTKKQWLLDQFRKGMLSELEMNELENGIESGQIHIEELDNFQDVHEFYSKQNIDHLWTGKSDDIFYQFLIESTIPEKDSNKFQLTRMLPIGIAASILLLLGVWIGNRDEPSTSIPIKDQNTQLLFSTQLEKTDDISQRIHLIVSKDEQNLDQKIIETLLYTLNTDESANVRIACIEVLSGYIQYSVVREGLISSIKYQVSPAVISNLIGAVKKGGANLSKEEFKSKLNKEIPEPLRNSIEESINKI